MNKNKLASWGNIVKDDLEKSFSNKSSLSKLDIGNLNSYGDCCLPLESISKETKSNIVVNTVIEYESQNNYYLYGTPGKSNVTIGGAIASDTHGKDNDWGGSFYRNIKNLTLNIDGEEIETSKDKNSEIFDATIGGYGLTGTITNVEFLNSNIPIYNSYETEINTGNGINSLLESFNTLDNEFWVGWIDLLSGKFRWVTKKSIPSDKILHNAKTKDRKEFDFLVPFVGNNRFNILGVINNLYYRINRNSNNKIIDYYQTFYPLSFITDTRNISYKRKIVQVQFSLPVEHEYELERLLTKLVMNQKPLLCSIKKLSNQKIVNNLSFYQHGWTVAVDFPHEGFNRDEIEKFYEELASFSGKIYLAKDFTLDEKNFRKMYPESLEWEKVVKEIDPNNTYQSELSNRLGLKKW